LARLEQGYISKELTHFVGKKIPNHDDRYQLLLNILKSGELKPSQFPVNIPCIVTTPSGRISDNELFTPYMVCFCDIPFEHLSIHIKKYGPFGLSFDKDFIVKNGGRPVQYIPRIATAKDKDGIITMAEYFDENVPEFARLFHLLIYNPNVFRTLQSNYTAINTPLQLSSPPDYDLLSQLDDLLLFHLFAYLKFYDHTLKDADPNNYYFEREWRVASRKVQFNLDDIKHIIIPTEYVACFSQDWPQFTEKLLPWPPN
jgi:hypothetical protein